MIPRDYFEFYDFLQLANEGDTHPFVADGTEKTLDLFLLSMTPFIASALLPTLAPLLPPPSIRSRSICSRISRICNARTTASGRPLVSRVSAAAIEEAETCVDCSAGAGGGGNGGGGGGVGIAPSACSSSWRTFRSSDRTYCSVWSLSVGRMFSSCLLYVRCR